MHPDSTYPTLEDDVDDPNHESGVRVLVTSAVVPTSLDPGAQLDEALLARLGHTDRLAQIGVLAASVAHEINNPAAFIMANLGMMDDYLATLSAHVQLLERVVEELPAERGAQVREEMASLDAAGHLVELGEMVDDNLTGIRHIADIVASLRTFSRNDPELSRVDIRRVVEAALHMVAKKVRERATLELDLGPVPPFTGQATGLAQVVMNLLVNAVHAIAPGSPKQNRIIMSTHAKDGCCVLSIEDTGCGMTPEVQARMYDPFFTTKGDGEGTGLGLSLCRDIARKHGGRMACISYPGAGTRFELIIPLDARPSKPIDFDD